MQNLQCRFPAFCNCRLIALFIEPYFIFQFFFPGLLDCSHILSTATCKCRRLLSLFYNVLEVCNRFWFCLSLIMLGIHIAETVQTPQNSFKILNTLPDKKHLLFLKSCLQLPFCLCQLITYLDLPNCLIFFFSWVST